MQCSQNVLGENPSKKFLSMSLKKTNIKYMERTLPKSFSPCPLKKPK
jgi:hypothetical protein